MFSKKNILSIIAIFVIVSVSFFGTVNAQGQPSDATSTAYTQLKPFKVVWSIYPGWMPIGYMKHYGIMDKWNRLMNVNVQIDDKPISYVGSLDAITLTNDYDACAMTNMDQLITLGKAGKPSTAIIVGDYSNGNDRWLSLDYKTVREAIGSTVHMELNTVSHYLVWRALQKNGMTFKDIKVAQMSEGEIGANMIEKSIRNATTWQPVVMNVMKAFGPKVHSLFTSADIPGEIFDMIVVKNASMQDNYGQRCVMAIVGAWYETMEIIKNSNTTSGSEAMAFMASQSNVTEAEERTQFETTYMYYTPQDALDYMYSEEFNTNIGRVYEFCVMARLLGRSVTDTDYLGLDLPTNTIFGNKDRIMIHFEAKYTEMAKAGTLVEEANKLK